MDSTNQARVSAKEARIAAMKAQISAAKAPGMRAHRAPPDVCQEDPDGKVDLTEESKEVTPLSRLHHQLPHELLTMIVDNLTFSADVRALQHAMRRPYGLSLRNWFQEQWRDRRWDEEFEARLLERQRKTDAI